MELTNSHTINFQVTPYLMLPKDRQVTSGILAGVKEGPTSNCDITKSMGSMQVCGNKGTLKVLQKHMQYFTSYDMDQHICCKQRIREYIKNRPNFALLNIFHKTMVLGDFNAHSTRWGYKNKNTAVKEIEDILNSSLLEPIYSHENPATYLHYNGTETTPDLFLVSSEISELTQRKVIDDAGSSHKPIIASITVTSKSRIRKMPTKKADWCKFKNLLEPELNASPIN
nr:pol protein [Hymenolepis microstoma]